MVTASNNAIARPRGDGLSKEFNKPCKEDIMYVEKKGRGQRPFTMGRYRVHKG